MKQSVSEIASARGSAGIWVLLGLLSVFAYSKYARLYLDLPELFHMIVILALCIATLFATFCAIHLTAIGGKSTRRIRKDLSKEIEQLQHLISATTKKGRAYEEEMIRFMGSTSRRAQEFLGKLKKIMRALETRANEAERLVRSKKEIDLIVAYELLGEKLVMRENSLSAVVDSDPIPPIAANDLARTINALLEDIEEELQFLRDIETERAA